MVGLTRFHPGFFLRSAIPAFGSQLSLYVYRPLQSAVDRTFVGDLEQPPPLLFRKLSVQLNHPLETIDSCLLGRSVTRFAVLCVDLLVRDVDMDVIEWPALAPRIHSNGHRCTCSQAR